MFWKDLQAKSGGVFKRLTGVRRSTFEKMEVKTHLNDFWDSCVRRSTFEKMADVVKEHITLNRKHPSRGAPAKAVVEDQLLMMLMYYREYRTFLHTATSYGYSESQGWRIVRKMEDILIQSGVFRLPGKKALLKMESGLLGKIILVDVGESPVERPKKSSGATTQAKRKDIPKKSS